MPQIHTQSTFSFITNLLLYIYIYVCISVSSQTNLLEMDYQYIVAGGILASTLVLLLNLFGSAAKKKATGSLHAEEINNDCAKTSSKNGTCPQEVVETTDVIIVGAGVAGAALAYTLGKDGRRVHVIERDLNEPDRTVGELLQPGGYLKLTELGLEDCVDKIDAQQVYGYVLYKDGKHVKTSFPLDKFGSHVSGRSFHNGRFIQRMRHKALSLPNVKLEQGTVTSLLEEKGIIKGVHYKTKCREELIAKAPLQYASPFNWWRND
ncbi:hypothetical protein Lal_00044060 [Lupinus albus]|uniref:Squalene monooxygenase n=1 Tax=Lupinus albus TaxID=3870 RepID=A0A6A4PE96_LUPAL|nr:putative squalene monooxygenase [Lupinus albus]KAF1895410.1 hypothetical protein Lal_00044060 [Lupinus albus]